MPKVRPKTPQYVKIRLNRQNSRNLHAPRITTHYLCNQKCPLAPWPYWPYKRDNPTAQRSVRPSAAAETMTGGGHFRHPGRRWLPCETGYFADLGVGDMPGARAPPKNRHPGGGGRPSATDC